MPAGRRPRPSAAAWRSSGPPRRSRRAGCSAGRRSRSPAGRPGRSRCERRSAPGRRAGAPSWPRGHPRWPGPWPTRWPAATACAARSPWTGPDLHAEARALALGAGTEETLEGLRRRAADPGWDAIVAAILLARDHGGDLARLLRATATSLEDGARLRADARGATAQARFTAWLVGGLPLGAAAVGALASPGALAAMLGDPLSAALLVVAGLCQVVAAVLIARIARLDDAPAA